MKKVRPVLVERCYECHSTGKKHRADLFLDSRAGMLKGGDNGPALVPGDPEFTRVVDDLRSDIKKVTGSPTPGTAGSASSTSEPPVLYSPCG